MEASVVRHMSGISVELRGLVDRAVLNAVSACVLVLAY